MGGLERDLERRPVRAAALLAGACLLAVSACSLARDGVKSGLSGLEYEFPVQGPLLTRIFGGL